MLAIATSPACEHERGVLVPQALDADLLQAGPLDERRPVGHLRPLDANPATKYFWSTANTAITGSVITTAPAISSG